MGETFNMGQWGEKEQIAISDPNQAENQRKQALIDEQNEILELTRKMTQQHNSLD